MSIDPQGIDYHDWSRAFLLAANISEHGKLSWKKPDGDVSLSRAEQPSYYGQDQDTNYAIWATNTCEGASLSWDAFLLPDRFPPFDSLLQPSLNDILVSEIYLRLDLPLALERPFVLWDGIIHDEKSFDHMLAIAMIIAHYCPYSVFIDGDLDMGRVLRAQDIATETVGIKPDPPVQFSYKDLHLRLAKSLEVEASDEIRFLLMLYQGTRDAEFGAFLRQIYCEEDLAEALCENRDTTEAAALWLSLGFDSSALSGLLGLGENEILSSLVRQKNLSDDVADYCKLTIHLLGNRAGLTDLAMYQLFESHGGIGRLQKSYDALHEIKEIHQIDGIFNAIREEGWF